MLKLVFKVPVLLIIVIIFLLIVLYLNFLWRKRDMIRKSWNFPGPINFPVIGAAYVFAGRPENILDQLLKLQKKYPQGWKIWFFNQLFYCISDPELIEKILGSKKHIEKKLFYKQVIDAFGNGLIQAPGTLWRRHRKWINPSFSQKSLNGFVEIFWKKSLILSEVLSQELYKEIDMFHLLLRCTLDIVSETSIGVKVEMQTAQGDNVDIAQNINKLLKMIYFKTFQPWCQIPLIWKILGYEKLFKQRLAPCNAKVHKVLAEKREAMETNTKNGKFAFLNCMFEQKYTPEEIHEEALAFMAAGSETTASSLTFLFTMFGLYPDIQQKVYKEVIQVLGENSEPQPNDLSKLVYTERVIKENLRLFPVGAVTFRHLTEDFDAGNFVIPKDTTLHFPVFDLHRNPKYYPDPLKFDPDRFLAEEVKKRPPCSYLPFSYGPRDCIGKTYGIMNMKVVIATLIRNFVFHTDYKKFEEVKVKTNMTLKFRDGSKLWLTKRT